MKAAILASPAPITKRPLQIVDVADPRVRSGHVLLRVRACGVCRTDLHIVEGELPPKQLRIIPGHQIVGEVIYFFVEIGARWKLRRFPERFDPTAAGNPFALLGFRHALAHFREKIGECVGAFEVQRHLAFADTGVKIIYFEHETID